MYELSIAFQVMGKLFFYAGLGLVTSLTILLAGYGVWKAHFSANK